MSEENSSGVTVTDAVTGETAFRGAAAAGELALNDAATGRRAYVIKNFSASQLAVADAGNHFSSDTVEGALQEIGAALDGVETELEGI